MVLRLTPPKPQLIAPGLRLAVLRALPFQSPGIRPLQVRHAILNQWAPSTISQALSALVREGVVQFEGPMGRRRYWRAD